MEERVCLPEDTCLPHLPFCRAAKTLQFFSSFQSYGNASLPRLWPEVFFIHLRQLLQKDSRHLTVRLGSAS